MQEMTKNDAICTSYFQSNENVYIWYALRRFSCWELIGATIPFPFSFPLLPIVNDLCLQLQ